MRKLYPTILLMLFTLTATAQLRFEDEEYFVAAVFSDLASPFAEVPTGPNLGIELDYVARWGYIRPHIDLYPFMEVPYMYKGVGLGLNLKSGGPFSPFRYYFGGKLGVIYRDWYKGAYPSVGVEAGINLFVTEKWIVGARGSYDYRTDFKYWNNPSEWRVNTLIRVGFKF